LVSRSGTIKNEDRKKPENISIALSTSRSDEVLCFEIKPDNTDPMQKKVSAIVYVIPSCVKLSPITKGVFNIDHAYITPAKSMIIMPIISFCLRTENILSIFTSVYYRY